MEKSLENQPNTSKERVGNMSEYSTTEIPSVLNISYPREMPKLIEKYGTSGPRYTSYPPVPNWEVTPSADNYLSDFQKEEVADPFDPYLGIQIYIHVPFCSSFCHYCGCYKIRPTTREGVKEYIEDVHKEWGIYLENLPPERVKTLRGIHLGGGTPNFLNASELDLLLSPFKKYYGKNDLNNSSAIIPDFYGSIEMDPRIITEAQLEMLYQIGFRKLSFGIQEFNREVQESVGRLQPASIIEKATSYARKIGYESVNYDLIYGLPNQTLETLEETLGWIEKLNPDTIAFYSYAHVPWHAQDQKKLEKFHLPEGLEKWCLGHHAYVRLQEMGYRHIGLDHYVRRDDLLSKAYDSHEMMRSFMGHSIRNYSHLVALGVSSISSTPNYYVQNEKDTTLYHNSISAGKLPFIKGHKKNPLDKVTYNLIQELMCYGEFGYHPSSKHLFAKYSEQLRLSYPELAIEITKKLEDFKVDHLIDFDGDVLKGDLALRVLESGKTFLRNLAMVFDYHQLLKKSSGSINGNPTTYSKTI